MELIAVEVHHYRIKKQNSKMYYITFTEPYKYFNKGFLQGYNFISFFCCYTYKNFELTV